MGKRNLFPSQERRYPHNRGSVAIMLEMFQRTEAAEMNDDVVIVQIDLDRKSTAQESLKVQRQIQKQSQETARA